MTARSKLSETAHDAGPLASALARREATALGILLLLAALFRAVRWVVTAAIFNDGPVFLALAEAMAAGEWATALGHEFHPLYPALTAALHAVVRDWELAAVTVNAVAGTAAVACLYGFTRAAFDRATAFTAAAILSVHPHAIEFSGDVQSEGLYLALFLGAVWALWLAIRNASLRAAAVAGFLCGLAYLTRPEGIGLLGVGGVMGAWHAVRGSWPLRRAAAWGALLLLAAACVSGPYVAWLRVDTGEWSLTQKKSVAWVMGLSTAPASPADEPGTAPQRAENAPAQPASSPQPTPENEKPAKRQRGEPSRLARYGGALLDLLRTEIRALRPELLAILLVGWWLGRWRSISLRGAYVLLLVGLYGIVLYGLASNVGYVSARHALPPLTAAYGHVAAALLAVAGALPKARRRLALALILAAIAGIGLGKALHPDRTDSIAERRAAEWLRAQELAPDGVAVRKRRVAYYAGARSVEIPKKPRRDLVREMRKLGASHLIIKDEDIGDYHGLAELLPRRARLLHREEAGGVSASVYAIFPDAEEGEAATPPPP